MKYQELIILLPCHSLEDFPMHHEGDEAEGLLANWSALWHPALLVSAESIPAWSRVDDPPESLAQRLIVVPEVSIAELPTGFIQRAKEEGACLIPGKKCRKEILSLALESLDGGDGGVDSSLAADFLALGYCYLQIELLTRQMRYSSNLDEIHFQNLVLAAAKAAISGDLELAKEKLAACFDVLAEERDHYYPVDAFVIDLTMTAPTTLGASLTEELAKTESANLLISGELLSQLAQTNPQALESLRRALEEERVSLIGGEEIQLPLPLLSYESILAELRRGIERYESLLGVRPKVFGRRRFGLTPGLPQVLQKSGFTGAFHATFEEGLFPEGSQFKIRWDGLASTAIDAVARPPLDASKPETYLGFALKMGESMDMDHVATVCLAHWPNQISPWLEDLRRISKYCSALGKFTTLDQYFRETDYPGQVDRFEASQYRSPYLKQAVAAQDHDPISKSVRYWRRRLCLEDSQSLSVLNCLVQGKLSDPDKNEISELAAEVDRSIQPNEPSKNKPSDLDDRLSKSLCSAADQLAETLSGGAAPQSGYLVFNPASYVRRIGVETPRLASLPAKEKPVYAVCETKDSKLVVVDVPPMGYVWLTPGENPPASKKPSQVLAEENVLRNDFFEVLINPTTGALQAIHEYNKRGNRLSQQLAMRYSTPNDQRQNAGNATSYSVMAADSVEVTAASTAFGEIVSSGHLLDRRGKKLASYRQKYQLWRGSRVLGLEIEIDPLVELSADPWNSYISSRFAWADETAELWRDLHQTRQHVTNKRFEAPCYIEIENKDKRTTILTGGLPHHRRCGLRMLDSLLIVRGERERTFKMGIGIDVKQPLQEARNLLTPAPVLFQKSLSPKSGAASWLFHIDARNVMATHWSELTEEGRIVGFSVRVLETAGRSARALLQGFRPVGSARHVDFQGESLGDLQIDEGRIRFDLGPHEWLEIEARWA